MATTAQPIRGYAKTTAKPIREFAKKLAFRFTRLGAPEYPYIVEPAQLAAFVNELDRVRDLPGSIVEIGVGRGMTTRFLCEHLVASGQRTEKFFAIDTFDSFSSRDVEFEVKHRGKTHDEIWGFGYIDFESWKKNFREFKFLTAYKADCSAFDYSLISPVKFAFIDVDLYLATKNALKKIYANLEEGGVILVDDVMQPCRWDGAYQAYAEFCSERGLPFQMVGNKMGVIYK
jgi:O-methyltransferase